jgi:hypothetical protein
MLELGLEASDIRKLELSQLQLNRPQHTAEEYMALLGHQLNVKYFIS